MAFHVRYESVYVRLSMWFQTFILVSFFFFWNFIYLLSCMICQIIKCERKNEDILGDYILYAKFFHSKEDFMFNIMPGWKNQRIRKINVLYGLEIS